MIRSGQVGLKSLKAAIFDRSINEIPSCQATIGDVQDCLQNIKSPHFKGLEAYLSANSSTTLYSGFLLK